jgi:hypothetical protein
MDFLAVTPTTVAVGKDRVNEYFDVRKDVLIILETESSSSEIQTINWSSQGLVELKHQKPKHRTKYLRKRIRPTQ